MHTLRATFAVLVLVFAPSVAAQTASFASEITVYNPNGATVTVDVAFYEANNSSAPGLKTCTDAVVPAGKSVQFTLSVQCALAAGNHFGLLVLSDVAGTNPIYGFGRVQNPQGIGFSTEGFPAENFNNQVAHATGLKKTTTGLIFQTNCFAGSLASPVNYTLKLFNGTTGAQIGSTITSSLNAFEQRRYLDVFAAPPNGVGPIAGDQLNVRAEFTSTNNALLVGFCTVQDNTSFGADFRIAKSYGSPNAFVQGGNAFGATAVLGTTDNNALDVRVNGSRVMRFEPNAISPNVIGGSPFNFVTPGVRGATIAGGGVASGDSDPDFINEFWNVVGDHYGSIGGGYANFAGTYGLLLTDAAFATVGGGTYNSASGFANTVSGGFNNTAIENFVTVAGGVHNVASGGGSTISGGDSNQASGVWSTIAGGFQNTAAGQTSFAAGYDAHAGFNGCFVWGDGKIVTGGVNCTQANQVVMRAYGGFLMITGASPGYIGAQLQPGSTAWSALSDRNSKERVVPVDGRAVLEKLGAIPIATWNWKSQDQQIRHMGPMAQDFSAAFGLGEDERHISTVDADGVALAAIQGLHALAQDQAREIADLKEQLAAVNVRVAHAEILHADLATMKAALSELQREKATVATR